MSGNSVTQEKPCDRCFMLRILLWSCLALPAASSVALRLLAMQSPNSAAGISKAAAQSCQAKVERIQAYGNAADPAKKQTTRLSEAEINSYLAIVLSPQYHPSLKSILLKFDEARIQGTASIDFDRLQFHSTQFLNSLFRKILTGVHTLKVRGNLVSNAGKTYFNLEDARFDDITPPNLLVSEIISAVGRKQNPPFDPMQPSVLPYRIQKVEVHSGYVTIYQ
jgi:hypothetical protein